MISRNLDCACLEQGPKLPNAIVERDLGVDEAEGRLAEVGLIRCARCQRLWLRYHYEVEAFTASGCWAQAPIDETTAAMMTADKADEFICAAPWRIIGGSLYGHAGRRVDGPVTAARRG